MATIDTEMQLQLAMQQAQQQQQPVPGAYAQPSSYISNVERGALGVTLGVTNIALPVAGLAGSVALNRLSTSHMPLYDALQRRLGGDADNFQPMSRARNALFGAGNVNDKNMLLNRGGALRALGTLDPFAAARMGWRAGGVLGTGGRILGGLTGFVGMGAATMAPAALVNAMGENMIEGQREFLATRQLMRELPATGNPFGAASVLSPSNMASRVNSLTSVGSVSALQGEMASLGSVYNASPSAMRNTLSGLAGMGAIDTRSAQTISQSFRAALSELKSIGKMVGLDLAEASQVYGQLRSMGFNTTGGRMQALGALSSTASLTGMGMRQTTSVAQAGMQAAMQSGMTAGAGFNLALNTLSTGAVRVAAGAVDANYLQRVGGLEGYARRMMELQMQASASPGAMAAMSRVMTTGGQVTGSALARLGSGRHTSMSSSFARDYDPYAFMGDNAGFSEMSGNILLGQVAGIQARYADNPVRANRRQYELLAEYGINDPREQLEYLGMLRGRTRGEAMQTAQLLQNRTLAIDRPESASRVDVLMDSLGRLTEAVVGSTNQLQRAGANLQTWSERVVQRGYDSVVGRDRELYGAAYTDEAVSMASRLLRQGQMPSFGTISGESARLAIDNDPGLRRLLGNSSGIAGWQPSAAGGVVGAGLRVLSPLTTRRGRGMGASYEGVMSFTGTRGTGVYMGLGSGGRELYATGNEFYQAMGLEFGQALDESGNLITANQNRVRGNLYRQSGLMGRTEENIIREYRPLRMGLLNASAELLTLGFFDSSAQGTQVSNLRATDRANLTGRDRSRHLDTFARELYGRGLGELSGQDRADFFATMRARGGMAAELVGGSDMDQAEFSALAAGQAYGGMIENRPVNTRSPELAGVLGSRTGNREQVIVNSLATRFTGSDGLLDTTPFLQAVEQRLGSRAAGRVANRLGRVTGSSEELAAVDAALRQNNIGVTSAIMGATARSASGAVGMAFGEGGRANLNALPLLASGWANAQMGESSDPATAERLRSELEAALRSTGIGEDQITRTMGTVFDSSGGVAPTPGVGADVLGAARNMYSTLTEAQVNARGRQMVSAVTDLVTNSGIAVASRQNRNVVNDLRSRAARRAVGTLSAGATVGTMTEQELRQIEDGTASDAVLNKFFESFGNDGTPLNSAQQAARAAMNQLGANGSNPNTDLRDLYGSVFGPEGFDVNRVTALGLESTGAGDLLTRMAAIAETGGGREEEARDMEALRAMFPSANDEMLATYREVIERGGSANPRGAGAQSDLANLLASMGIMGADQQMEQQERRARNSLTTEALTRLRDAFQGDAIRVYQAYAPGEGVAPARDTPPQ